MAARLFRISFSGELAYELAVPASNPAMIDKAADSAADFVFLDLEDALDLLLSLLEIKVDTLADEMEQAYRTLEAISRLVLGRDADDLEDAIDGLAEQEDLVGKVRLCLMDGQRDLKFLCRQRSFLPELKRSTEEM